MTATILSIPAVSPRKGEDLTANTLSLSWEQVSFAEARPANRDRFPMKADSYDSVRVDGHTRSKYQPFWVSDQAGLSIIAHDLLVDHNIVAVKVKR